MLSALGSTAVTAGVLSNWALSATMVVYLWSKPPIQHTLIDSFHVSK